MPTFRPIQKEEVDCIWFMDHSLPTPDKVLSSFYRLESIAPKLKLLVSEITQYGIRIINETLGRVI